MADVTRLQCPAVRSGSDSTGVRKGAWTSEEDLLLKKCVEKFGEGQWHLVPARAGLRRCRKSCRMRWLNYLKPTIKRGEFEEDEVDLILRMHRLLGNRWALIAGRIPGRTANDIKNYWNTILGKKVIGSHRVDGAQATLAAAAPPVNVLPRTPRSSVRATAYVPAKQISSCAPVGGRTAAFSSSVIKPKPRIPSEKTFPCAALTSPLRQPDIRRPVGITNSALSPPAAMKRKAQIPPETTLFSLPAPVGTLEMTLSAPADADKAAAGEEDLMAWLSIFLGDEVAGEKEQKPLREPEDGAPPPGIEADRPAVPGTSLWGTEIEDLHQWSWEDVFPGEFGSSSSLFAGNFPSF